MSFVDLEEDVVHSKIVAIVLGQVLNRYHVVPPVSKFCTGRGFDKQVNCNLAGSARQITIYLFLSQLQQLFGELHVLTVIHLHGDDTGDWLGEGVLQHRDQVLRFFHPVALAVHGLR